MKRVKLREPPVRVRKSRPFRFIADMRLVSQTTLVRGLIEEIERGSSVTRLYAQLLVDAILEREPKHFKKSKYGRWLAISRERQREEETDG